MYHDDFIPSLDTLNGPNYESSLIGRSNSHNVLSLDNGGLYDNHCNLEPCWDTLFRNQIDQIIEKRLTPGHHQTIAGESCGIEKQLLLKYLINEQHLISFVLSKWIISIKCIMNMKKLFINLQHHQHIPKKILFTKTFYSGILSAWKNYESWTMHNGKVH